MVEAGRLEEIDCWTEHLSRGFFVEKQGKEEVQARLVADFRSVNRKIRRPEIPLEGSWNILKRLDPHDSYFACVDFSSGFSQLTLDEGSRDLFVIILPWGKFRYCVLPQGTSASPEIFDIKTSPKIRNQKGVYKNADDVMGASLHLHGLDIRMRKAFDVCRERKIKVNPSKLQCGKKVRLGGMMIKTQCKILHYFRDQNAMKFFSQISNFKY